MQSYMIFCILFCPSNNNNNNFPRVILYNFFSFLLIYGGLGFWGWGLGLGFLGLGFSIVGVLGLWCGAFGVFLDWGSLYKHRRTTLGKKLCLPGCETALCSVHDTHSHKLTEFLQLSQSRPGTLATKHHVFEDCLFLSSTKNWLAFSFPLLYDLICVVTGHRVSRKTAPDLPP